MLLKMLVVLLVVLLGVKGCMVALDELNSPKRAYHEERWEALKKIEVGMTRTQAAAIMGTPGRTTTTSPVPDGMTLPESIEANIEADTAYAGYLNGRDNVYIIAFDADGLVIGKAYMWEGPMWEEREGTIRSRPKEQPTEQAAEPEAR